MMKEPDLKIIGVATTLLFTLFGSILVLGTSGFTEAVGLALLVIGLIISIINIILAYIISHNDIVKALIFIILNLIPLFK